MSVLIPCLSDAVHHVPLVRTDCTGGVTISWFYKHVYLDRSTMVRTSTCTTVGRVPVYLARYTYVYRTWLYSYTHNY